MWRIHIAHRRCEQGFQGGAAPLGTRTLVQSLVCYTLIEVYRILICKKPHANTLMVRTWDLMLPRPSRILVTNPDWQLPCHFSKTVLRIPRTGELPVVHIAIVCGFNRKFYKQSKSQQPVCDMQFTVVANESNRELRWQGASGWTHPVFYYASSFSARSIRYPTPTWVWIRCGASGYRSNFLRRDAI